MTIQGRRYRVGNPNHPFNNIYKQKGFKAVYEAMGLLESRAVKIKKEVLALYDTVVEGDVYIITNPAWPDWIKVGMAVDASDRCNGYQTSSPFRDYEVLHSFKTEDRRKAEREAHDLIEQHAVERKGEWFKIQPEKAIHLFTTIH